MIAGDLCVTQGIGRQCSKGCPFPPPTRAFEGRLQRESMWHLPTRRACKFGGWLSCVRPMDSRFRGNDKRDRSGHAFRRHACRGNGHKAFRACIAATG